MSNHVAVLFALVLLWLSGCSLNGVSCLPGDDSETCCLKEHPGAWERCAGVAGPKPKPKEKPSPPVLPRLPTEDEQEEWNERCAEHYERCKHSEEGESWGRVFKESQCKACWHACRRTGEWPEEANDKPCPGG